MHQFSNITVIAVCAINIDNMSTIIKIFSILADCFSDMIYRHTFAPHIILCYKYDINIWKLLEFCSFAYFS